MSVMKHRQPGTRKDFAIAILCALTLEADAVDALFDEIWEDEKYGKAPCDPNAYTLGRIGRYNVVLAHMPGMGKVNAATVAASFESSFQGIQLGLVVGICGGVPRGTDGKEILLGDVIISTGLVQFDFGRQLSNEVVRKDTVLDNLGRPNLYVRNFLSKAQGRRVRASLSKSISIHLTEICNKEGFEESIYPGADEDVLYDPAYRHKHHDSTCTICANCKNGRDEVCGIALEMTCAELDCNRNKQVNRLSKINHASVGSDKLEEAAKAHRPLIHFGLIATGDVVIQSSHHRDEIAAKHKVIAFEMEGAGMWDKFPTIVIKSVCDYADSHKNKRWQSYAAVTAAACMKAVLKEWALVHPTSDDPIHPRDTADLSSIDLVRVPKPIPLFFLHLGEPGGFQDYWHDAVLNSPHSSESIISTYEFNELRAALMNNTSQMENKISTLIHEYRTTLLEAAENFPLGDGLRNLVFSAMLKLAKGSIQKDGVTCRTLLHYMAMNGVDDILLPLIEAGFEVNDKDSDFRTPLHLAVIGNHVAATTALVEKADADVHARDLNNLLPFHYALSIDVDNIVENEDRKKSKERILRLLTKRTALDKVRNANASKLLKKLKDNPEATLSFDGPPVKIGR